MNICICTCVTLKNINNGSCLKHKKGRHSYLSVSYQAYVTRMRPYVAMYPNYYPYDNNNNNNNNNHNNNNNNNNNNKRAWSAGGGGGSKTEYETWASLGNSLERL